MKRSLTCSVAAGRFRGPMPEFASRNRPEQNSAGAQAGSLRYSRVLADGHRGLPYGIKACFGRDCRFTLGLEIGGTRNGLEQRVFRFATEAEEKPTGVTGFLERRALI